MRQKLTVGLARAAGTDAGNRSMRKASRAHWNEVDYNVAAQETNRLLNIAERGGQMTRYDIQGGMIARQ